LGCIRREDRASVFDRNGSRILRVNVEVEAGAERLGKMRKAAPVELTQGHLIGVWLRRSIPAIRFTVLPVEDPAVIDVVQIVHLREHLSMGEPVRSVDGDNDVVMLATLGDYIVDDLGPWEFVLGSNQPDARIVRRDSSKRLVRRGVVEKNQV